MFQLIGLVPAGTIDVVEFDARKCRLDLANSTDVRKEFQRCSLVCLIVQTFSATTRASSVFFL